MKTCIIYTTMHGCTEKCAEELKSHLASDAVLFNLKHKTPKELKSYDQIVIGGSIHAGHIQRKIKTFCEKHEALLLQKNLGLFLCCMEDGENAQTQFNNAFPESWRRHAKATGLFGGEFDFNKMGFMAKAIVKKVANVTESVDHIKHESIEEFAVQMS